MRLYSPSREETLRVRRFLKDWAGEGFLSKEQYERLEVETASELRSTNIFLRLVLFFFTLIGVAAAAGLFFVVFLPRAPQQIAGIFFLIFAAVWYSAAEFAVSKFRLYRYGIEEALAVCALGFLCMGLQAVVFGGRLYSPAPDEARCLVPAAGAIFSFWIWRRFGLWYAFPAAMIFVVFLPGYWTASLSARHLIVAGLYAAGLMWIATLRPRHRLDYLDDTYSLAEAFLWLGIYLAANLRLSSLDLLALDLGAQWSGAGAGAASEFARPFYWSTWVFIWCLPPVVLARGFRLKDRALIAVGAIAAILTFVSNKPYLGWRRHTWDPMILGVLLTGVALFIRAWLARGPGGIRHGFTAARLSGKDKHWMSVGSPILGLIAPESITPTPPASPDFRFGGGASGGGGASSDF